MGQRLHRIVQQPPTQGVPQPQPLDHPVRGPGSHRGFQTRAQSPTPTFGLGLPDAGRVRCGVQAYPHPGGLRDLLNPKRNNPTLKPGGLSNGDSPQPSTAAHYRKPLVIHRRFRNRPGRSSTQQRYPRNRLVLLPMKGPKTDADMALNFVRQDDLSDDELKGCSARKEA